MEFATRFASMPGARGLATAMALVLSASPVLAQNPKAAQQRPAAPAPAAPAPAAPAAPNAGPAVVQLKPEPAQPEWTKICGSHGRPRTNRLMNTTRFPRRVR